MKRTMLITLALILFAGTGAFGQGTALPPPSKTPIYNPPYNNDPVKPFRMIGNIYFLGRRNYTAFLIATPAGLMILDTEGEQYVDEIRKNIEALGFHMKDVKYLLQTHAHSDHVGGLAGLKELTGAKVAVMAQDAESIASGREAPGTEDVSNDAIAPVMAPDATVLEDGGKSDFRSDGRLLWKPVHPDQILHDGDKITLGGTTMVAHLTAGHTKGCTSWSMVTEEGGKRYNAVFACSNRVNDGIPLVKNEKYPTVADDFAHGFETLAKLPCDVFLASHSYMFDLDGKLAQMNQGATTNPFIDPQGYRQFVSDYKNAFEEELKKEKAGAPPTPRPGG